MNDAKERQGLILSVREAQAEFKGKILKNKDSGDMKYEDKNNVEKDEDKKMLDEEYEKEMEENGLLRGLTKGDDYFV